MSGKQRWKPVGRRRIFGLEYSNGTFNSIIGVQVRIVSVQGFVREPGSIEPRFYGIMLFRVLFYTCQYMFAIFKVYLRDNIAALIIGWFQEVWQDRMHAYM